MPRLPSEIVRARQAGWSEDDILDFDLGMLWFNQWIEAKRSETVDYTPDKNAKPQRPRYTSMAEIFDEYDATMAADKFTGSALPMINVAAVIEAAFGDEVLF